MQSPSTTAIASSRANPIDLTDEDDLDISEYIRSPTLTTGRIANTFSRNGISLGPLSSQQPALPKAPATFNTTPFHPTISLPSTPMNSVDTHTAYHPQFGVPSMRPPPLGGVAPHPQSHHIPPAYSAPGRPGVPSAPGHPPVIDLTSTPSPPPMMAPMLNSLPPDLPLKTPVCIGQLQVTALVLYPIQYLTPSEHGGPDAEWACVRTQYEHCPQKAPNSQETIHIKSPNWKTPMGENIVGETFGVVEQKVASSLGPMLGKQLIRVEARVRRGGVNLPILPLILLVYTPKGNIQVVGNFLREQNLLLDHPFHPSDIQRLTRCHYFNPHNPPPGGHARIKDAYSPHRVGYTGPGVHNSRWANANVNAKSVEVQRSQADELFKHLQTGEELPETEAPPEIKTKLYPHQKKAITFLLEREGERLKESGQPSSLWTRKIHPFSDAPTWTHMVTGKESLEEPFESKGAILADDMGLGKTITTVSLVAATLPAARTFAAEPLPRPAPPPPRLDTPDLTAAHFAGNVWGMPDPVASSLNMSAKQLAKANREADKLEVEYARACRLKVKSRGTLIICPLSTISNWEDQFREHWNGPVTIVGGGGISCTAAGAGGPLPLGQRTLSSAFSSMGPLTQSLLATEGSSSTQTPVLKLSAPPTPGPSDQGARPCRVYVYHGNARRPDPAFLADFDAVITTYSTLATEFSKQSKSTNCADGDDDELSAGDIVEIDEMGQQLPKKKGVKRKKCITSAAEVSSPLQSVCWFRVVLDEAHSIKETGTVACRACCDLEADRRLCLTGTPVQNKLDDIFALIKFLRLEPFTDKAVWTEYIGTPVKFGQAIGIARLQTIMKIITLRRTKESRKEDGERILALPPRRDELRFLKFEPDEQAIYDMHFKESKTEFAELSKRNEVMKNYVGILQKILRLRQICDHYELVQDKSGGANTQSWEDLVAGIAREGLNAERAAAVFTILRESASAQCAECGVELAGANAENLATNGMEECAPSAPKRGRKTKTATSTRQNSPTLFRPVLTRCQHVFCPNCFRTAVFPNWPQVAPTEQRTCSACPTLLLPNDAVEVNPEPTLPEAPAVKKKPAKKEKRQKGSAAAETFIASTKIKSLMTDLLQLSRANPHSANYDPNAIEIESVDEGGCAIVEPPTKTIVFSQWTTMLDKIEDALELAGIRYERLDGTMRREERVHAMDALKTDPACEILLVSLKAGGVGLNLTSASRVYLMDPYWNPAVEHQAVDRVHRLGQTRPVTTIKLVIENTIEDKLLKVQKRKEALANMTLGPSISKAEVVQRRLEELMQLFDS